MADDDREARVRDRAYRIWVEHGRPEGRHVEHWIAAEQAVDEEDAAVSPLGSLDADPVPVVTPNR